MKEKVDLLRRQIEKLYRLNFYKKKLDQAGIKPSSIKTIDDFRKIPFTSSPEILEELKKKPSECSLYNGEVTRVNFSPSGQELYPVYQTKRDLKKMHEVCARTLKTAGILWCQSDTIGPG
jgi:phenylacetate-CoA ligase